MPKFETLSEAEIERLKKRKAPKLNLTEYLSYLATLRPGDWGAVRLENGDSARAIKRRLTIAAKGSGMNIKYRTGEEDRVVFEVK